MQKSLHHLGDIASKASLPEAASKKEHDLQHNLFNGDPAWAVLWLNGEDEEAKQIKYEFILYVDKVLSEPETEDKETKYNGFVSIIVDDKYKNLPETAHFSEKIDESVLFSLLMLTLHQCCVNKSRNTLLLRFQKILNFCKNARDAVSAVEIVDEELLWSKCGFDFPHIKQAYRKMAGLGNDSNKIKKTNSIITASQKAVEENLRKLENLVHHTHDENDSIQLQYLGKGKMGGSLLLSPLAHAVRYGNIETIKTLTLSRFNADPTHEMQLGINESIWPNPYDIALYANGEFNAEPLAGVTNKWQKKGWNTIRNALRNDADNKMNTMRNRYAICNAVKSVKFYIILLPLLMLGVLCVAMTSRPKGNVMNQFSSTLSGKVVHNEFSMPGEPGDMLTFTDIEDSAEFWYWLENPFQGTVFTVPLGQEGKKVKFDGISTVIGPIELRQLRMERIHDVSKCSGDFRSPIASHFAEKEGCFQDIHFRDGKVAEASFGPPSEPSKYVFERRKSLFNGLSFDHNSRQGDTLWRASYPVREGYFQLFDATNATAFRSQVAQLKSDNWISQWNGTRAIFLDFSVYNPHINILGVVKLGLEFWPSGAVTTSSNVRVLDVELDESDALYQKVLFSTVFVLFIIRIVGEVFDCCSGHEKAFWNYVDDKQSAKEIASRRKKQKIAPVSPSASSDVKDWGIADQAKQPVKRTRSGKMIKRLTSQIIREKKHKLRDNQAKKVGDVYATYNFKQRVDFRIRFWVFGRCGCKYARVKASPGSIKKKETPYSFRQFVWITFKKNNYFKDYWNLFEFFITVFFFFWVIDFLDYLSLREKVSGEIMLELKGEKNVFMDLIGPYVATGSRMQDLMACLFVVSGVHSMKLFLLFPYLGPRVMAITATFFHPHILPFYVFLLSMMFYFSLGFTFAFGSEVTEFRNFFHSQQRVLLALFGDFGLNLDAMEASNVYVSFFIFVIMVITLTMVMMNIFIAVVSEVYANVLSKQHSNFDNYTVDRAYFHEQGTDKNKAFMEHFMNEHVRKLQSQGLERIAKEQNQRDQETMEDTVSRLLKDLRNGIDRDRKRELELHGPAKKSK